MNLKYRLVGLACCLVLHAGFSYAQTAKEVVLHLNQMLRQKSAEPFKSDLSEAFSVAAYTNQSAVRILQTLAERYECDSVTLVKQVASVDGNKIDIQLFSKGKAPVSSAVYADKYFKVLYVDLFDQLYGMNRYQQSKLRVKIPFETENGSIILKLKLNNSPRVLRMLFDTGADGMAVSQALADSIGLKVSRKQNASVVGGNMEISVSEGNVVHLDSFTIKDQAIALFKEMHRETDGIIGNSIAKRYITKIDYDKKELSLYDFGDYQYEKAGASVPVTVPSGVFIIPGALSITTEPAHQGEFVFDTGAGYNLICFRPFVKKNKLLVSGFKSEYNGTTASMGMVTPTFSGRAASFSFSNMPAVSNMPITLMAGGGQSETWNPGFDGSIGIRTISRYNFTINMQKKEIHFSPNKTYNYPYDFAIGGYLFGFNIDGVLKVLSLTAPENAKVSLKDGVVVKSINGIATLTLLKDNKQFKKLIDMPAGTAYVVESVQSGMAFKDTIIK